jgi:hypothetical protein
MKYILKDFVRIQTFKAMVKKFVELLNLGWEMSDLQIKQYDFINLMHNKKFNISTTMEYVMNNELKFDSVVSIGLHSIRYGLTKSYNMILHCHLMRVLKEQKLKHRMDSIKRHIQSCTALWIHDYVLTLQLSKEDRLHCVTLISRFKSHINQE